MSAYSFLRINILKEIINQAVLVCRMSTRLKKTTKKKPSNTEVYLLQKSRDGLDGRICEATLKM